MNPEQSEAESIPDTTIVRMTEPTPPKTEDRNTNAQANLSNGTDVTKDSRNHNQPG